MIARTRYLDRMTPYLHTPVIKVITGMRRTGKSTMLQQLSDYCVSLGAKPAGILQINMESLEYANITDGAALNDRVRKYFGSYKGQRYLFIDEVQEIPDWEKAVASLLAEKKTDITITGSNAHLLSSELATLITGRYVTLPVYPLTFSEHCVFRGLKNPEKNPQRADEFTRYLRYGGLPGIHQFPDVQGIIDEYLSSVMNSILLRDVVMRSAVRDPAMLERVCRFVFDAVGSIITAKRIADYAKSQRLKMTVDTAINYLRFLENAYLINRVPRYDIRGRRQLELYDKYYMGDLGLRHGFLGYRDGDIGGLLENVVHTELRARGYSVAIGKSGEYEIDFVAQRGEEKIYIQVAYLLAQEETVEREYRALESIPDSYPKYLLTMDPVRRTNRNGIVHQNLVDYLLAEP